MGRSSAIFILKGTLGMEARLPERHARLRDPTLSIHHREVIGSWPKCGSGSAGELQQPALDEPERRIFQEAGKEALFEEARGVPAVLIVRWKRQA